jgi:hypothetical protein
MQNGGNGGRRKKNKIFRLKAHRKGHRAEGVGQMKEVQGFRVQRFKDSPLTLPSPLRGED